MSATGFFLSLPTRIVSTAELKLLKNRNDIKITAFLKHKLKERGFF
jgi:hypothetical protein